MGWGGLIVVKSFDELTDSMYLCQLIGELGPILYRDVYVVSSVLGQHQPSPPVHLNGRMGGIGAGLFGVLLYWQRRL